MKRFLGAAALGVAALVMGAAAASADTATAPYSGWNDAGGANGDWGGTYSSSSSVDVATGDFGADASASEPSGPLVANGTPAQGYGRAYLEHNFTVAAAGTYRVTVVLSDVDATLSSGDWGEADVEADINASCDCDWPFVSHVLAKTDLLHRSVSVVDGVYTISGDITVHSAGTVSAAVEVWAMAVASSNDSRGLMHGGPATASVTGTVESISLDAV